jgi:hypothetical protein
MPHGEKVRCYGFRSDDGEWAHCTREEYAGDVPFNEKSGAFVHRLSGDCKCGVRHDPAPPATLTPNGARPTIFETTSETREERYYVYEDADGKPCLRVHRTAYKQFFQQHWDGEAWQNGLAGRKPILYRLPEILHADPSRPVFVVEGEKDADRLAREGLLATTNPMGAGKWQPEYAEVLKGRTVYVVPDNDGPGEKHAEQVKASIPGAKIVRLPELPPKGDVSDWLDAGGTAEELVEIARRAHSEAAGDAGRVMLGQVIRDGVEPPETLVDDVLLAGKAHSIYGPPGLGKTFLMLWLILEVVKRGESTVLFDAENGVRPIAERLKQLGADAALLDERVHYFPYPSLTISEEARRAYVALLERVRPALVCFDS